MKNSELKNKAVEWLETQSKKQKTRPQQLTPSEIATAIDGKYTAIGQVVDEILIELQARGIHICYRKINNRRYFEML